MQLLPILLWHIWKINVWDPNQRFRCGKLLKHWLLSVCQQNQPKKLVCSHLNGNKTCRVRVRLLVTKKVVYHRRLHHRNETFECSEFIRSSIIVDSDVISFLIFMIVTSTMKFNDVAQYLPFLVGELHIHNYVFYQVLLPRYWVLLRIWQGLLRVFQRKWIFVYCSL